MKRINILKYLTIIGIVAAFTSCNPYQDNFNEIDAAVQTVKQDVELTLEKDDYELSGNSNAARFGNFSNVDDAKAGIPNILKEKFPFINGDGSFAAVTYDIYNGGSPYLGNNPEAFTVTGAEYDALGFRFGNFSNLSVDLPKYANFKKPDARNGDYMDITHDFYNGRFTERGIVSRAVYTVAYGWQYTMILPEEAYGDFFSESGTDFSNESEGEEKMTVYLNYLLTSASNYNDLLLEAGQTLVVQYNYDDRRGSTGNANEPSVGLYVFNGTEWLLYSDAYQITQELLTFGLDAGVWVPDNTIKYELIFSDYNAIVASSVGTEASRGNMGNFGNFNYTGGSTSWTDEDILAALVLVIKNNFPNDTASGQKFEVTFSAYNGATVNFSWKIIINDAGQYVRNE